MADGSFQRFIGGSPAAVLAKLVFLSLLVGAFMAFLGLTPFGLIEGLVEFVESVFGSGLEALREAGRWLLYGAMIVVPVFFLVRLLGAGRR